MLLQILKKKYDHSIGIALFTLIFCSCSSDPINLENSRDSDSNGERLVEGALVPQNLPEITNTGTREDFSFIQLSDTQLGLTDFSEDSANFERAVEKINASNADFVVICGDLVQDGVQPNYTEFNRIKSLIHIPVYVVSGNHDIGLSGDTSRLNFYRDNVAQLFYHFSYERVGIVITNSQFWKVDWGELSNTHDAWVKSTLQNYRALGYRSLVLGHYPLYINSSDEIEGPLNLSISKRDELLTLFKENNVQAYLSGHYHGFIEHHNDGIALVTGETTSKNFDGSPLGYRHWEVTNDSISHTFVPLY